MVSRGGFNRNSIHPDVLQRRVAFKTKPKEGDQNKSIILQVFGEEIIDYGQSPLSSLQAPVKSDGEMQGPYPFHRSFHGST